eukprot:1969019-Ditylum_brightwellii.AAC.1
MLPDQIGSRHPKEEWNLIFLSLSMCWGDPKIPLPGDYFWFDCVWYLYTYCIWHKQQGGTN